MIHFHVDEAAPLRFASEAPGDQTPIRIPASISGSLSGTLTPEAIEFLCPPVELEPLRATLAATHTIPTYKFLRQMAGHLMPWRWRRRHRRLHRNHVRYQVRRAKQGLPLGNPEPSVHLTVVLRNVNIVPKGDLFHGSLMLEAVAHG